MIRKLFRLTTLAFAIALPLLFGLVAAHADEVDDWYAAVCGDQSLIRWAVGIFGTTFAASLLANLRNRLPAGMAPVLDALALNFVKSLKSTAQQAKVPVILLAVLAVGALSACSTAQLQQAQQDIGTVSADVLQTVAAACQEAAPLAAPIANAPAGAVSPGVKSVAGYALSICSPQGTVLAGVKVDPSTAFWLGTLKAALEAATVPAAAKS